mgnify:CR=1 FL=1
MTPVYLLGVTPDAGKHRAYVSRVRNPKKQDDEKFAGLLRYCIKHGHGSVFEQAHMTVEINTTRGLAAQILRHRSFTYQEFSQRYADSTMLSESIATPELRRPDQKNRQNSIDDVDDYTRQRLEIQIVSNLEQAVEVKKERIESGIAKECARV